MVTNSDISNLLAVSPIDGRYCSKTKELSKYFSESALIYYRLRIEIGYLIELSKVIPNIKDITDDEKSAFHLLCCERLKNAIRIKDIEKTTNHDVKAIEYYLVEKLKEMGKPELVNFVHFGLTSQDVCSLATACAMKEFNWFFFEIFKELLNKVHRMALDYREVPMLARTHGQPASPMPVGMFFATCSGRMFNYFKFFDNVRFTAKFGGATGGMNAHYLAYPNGNWHNFADNFVNYFGVSRSFPTSQVDHNDVLIDYFNKVRNINNILIGFCQDMWTYISMGYFKIKVSDGHIGSSTMPHKINPINFENAEGNLGMANAILEHFTNKFSKSRLQRDLSDSTVFRNLGVPFAHTIMAYESIIDAMNKLEINESAIKSDLNSNWSVITEGIQTILRRDGYSGAYESLMDFCRSNVVTQESLEVFINSLDIVETTKNELHRITPFNYVGKY